MTEVELSPSRRRAPGAGVTAVLGPTNTGKTHLAIERMLGHRSGMIGLPLRLLAREVYDRIVARLGPRDVALITGEEKIVPAAPRFYVSTVEAMPLDVAVDFLAVDEIQLAADAERGHIFTERLLHARGQSETMLLGSATMTGLIQTLLPGTNFVARARFSKLTYAGQKKLTRLPRRSTIVAFSADGVYALAELVRRQRGGAAVVLGALSPRTRNAQVELFQSGDVDFLVATDAIGMGLNMDVDHVAFSAKRKFDGERHRMLTAVEWAQIAGRAGRHMNDGTFGVTGECEAPDAELIERVESHRFEPARVLQWRNRDLDVSSIDALIASLAEKPRQAGLTRTRSGDDMAVLEYLARSESLRQAAGPAAVKRLWEVCQIPDYRRIGIGDHAQLVAKVFGFLMSDGERVPEDWLARQVAYADRTDGDIDTLANRIAHIRTWTFVANRPDWLGDARHWQERTQAVEDRLSDALHEQLTQRFVDRRTSVLIKRMKEKDQLLAGVGSDGQVVVEGEYVGRLEGLRFALDTSAGAGADARALQAAAMKVLSAELSGRAQVIAAEEDGVFAVTPGGYATWRGTAIARLEGGDQLLMPQIRLLADDQLPAPDRDAVRGRMEAWLKTHLREALGPLMAIGEDEAITGLARGVGFQLVEHLGLMPREKVATELAQLDQPARASLRRHGVRFGAFSVHIPALVKPHPAALRLVLFKLWQEARNGHDRDDWPEAPAAGLTSFRVASEAPAEFYAAAGYRLCGPRAVRADMLERLADTIRPLIGWKPVGENAVRPDGAHPSGGFTVTPTMMSLVGCSGEDFTAILTALGYRSQAMAAPRVVASVAPAPEAAAAGPADAAFEPESAAPASEPVAQPAAEGAPETGAEPAGEAVPAADAAQAAGAQAAPVPDGASAGEAPAPEAAPATIEVWRPRPRHRPGAEPRRARDGEAAGDARPPRRQRRKSEDGGGAPAPFKGRGRRDGRKGAGKPPPGIQDRAAPAKPARPPMRPEDSPFAALQALKDAMTSNSGGAASE